MEDSNSMNTGDIVILTTAAAGVVMIFVAGQAIAFAMVTAFISTAGAIYIFYSARGTKYGAKIWNFMMKHTVITDLSLTGVFLFLFGTSTATALLAGGAAGAMVSACLLLIRKYSANAGLVPVPINNKQEVTNAGKHKATA
jgi:hypothetical protein